MASFGDVDRNVTITFIGRDNASRAMGSIGSSASRTTKIVGGLVKALKYAAMAAAAALAAGAVLLAKGLIDATKAAYADDIAMKKLAYTQGKAQDATRAQTDATSEWIDKMELATRFSDDEMRPAYTALALTGMSVKRSTDLMRVAMDLAEAKGKPLLSVTEALAKGYNGTVTSLQRMGIKTTDAAGNALKFSEILKKLKERTKGAAKEAAKTDPWTVMGHAIEQVKEEIGKEFLPMARKFSEWVIKVAVPYIKEHLVPWVRKLADWLGKELPKAAQAISDWWSKSGREAFSQLWGKIKDVWNKTVDLVAALSGKNGAETKLSDAGDAATDAVDGMTSLADAVGKLVGALEWIETHGDWLSKLQWLGENINVLGQAKTLMDGLQGDAKFTIPSWMNPMSAKGGWLHRAQGGWGRGWTMVGEHGAELINNRGYVKPHSASMGGAGGGGITINVNGAIDPVGTARQIRNILAKGDRAGGRGALGLA